MIFVLGGGSDLNYKVVGGTSQPTSPKENTIWVNTSNEITNWIFQYSQPSSWEGRVWFSTSLNAPWGFPADKKRRLWICPVAAYQYISDAWVQKTAKIYYNGAWKDWFTYLFNQGQVNTALTGGINGTIKDGALAIESASIGVSNNKTYTTVNAVDLTGINTIYAKISSPNTVTGIYFRLLVDDVASNGDSLTTGSLKAYFNTESPFNGEERTVSLDVSSLTGTHYIGYAWGVVSDANATRQVTGYVKEIWMA